MALLGSLFNRLASVTLVVITFSSVSAGAGTQHVQAVPPVPSAGESAHADDSLPEPAPSSSADPPRFAWQAGPLKVELGHDLVLDLPEGYMYLDKAEATRLMERMGNLWNESLLAVAMSQAQDENWFTTVRYEEEGYVKDDEKVDSDELLKALREGMIEANKERESRGFKPLHVNGWFEAPHYDKAKHHLVWGLDLSDSDGKTLNYNTRILGRKGYVSLNLVTAPEELAAAKPKALPLLEGTQFEPGSRYEDFDSNTDKVAEYGLAGLVLGGAGLTAAKLVKVGLLAQFGKVLIGLLVAGKKLIIIGLLGAAAFAKKIFGSLSGSARHRGDSV